jgi:hypothetical protein
MVRNVTIENVTVGGKRLTAPEAGLLEVNEFVDGLHFR